MASAGFVLLGIWLILTGLSRLARVNIPNRDIVLAVLAVIAGILILLGYW